MRSIAALSILALGFARAASAQADSSAVSCSGPHGPPLERLRALALQYHPEALAPENGRASVLVAFVLDPNCQVLNHATGQRAGEQIDVDSTLASLFPGVQIQPWVMEGIAAATVGDPQSQGRPWIVWAVKKG